MQVALCDVAHSRSGDKGTLTTLSLIAYRAAWYPALVEQVTVERVCEHLGDRLGLPAKRYEVPSLLALNFVCARTAGDTVTTSLNLDTHGKGLSDALLTMQIELDTTLQAIRAELSRS